MKRKENSEYFVEFSKRHTDVVEIVPCPSLDVAKAVCLGLYRDPSFVNVNVVYKEVIPAERFLDGKSAF